MIGVVTTFFDFFYNSQRLEVYQKYRSFIKRCGVPHVTVEFKTTDQEFRLHYPEAIRYETPHPKFHKTNGINIGARELIKQGCKYIAWMDADNVLSSTDWPNMAVDKLKHCDVIQLQHRCWREAATTEDKFSPSIVAAPNFRGHDGGGWAARAEFFEELGHFDCIVSGANKMMLSGVYDKIWTFAREAYACRIAAYAEKMKRFNRLGFLPLDCFQYNHGNPKRGQLCRTRFKMLQEIDFDFDRDCYYDSHGVIHFQFDDWKAEAIGKYLAEREGKRLQSKGNRS